MPRPKLSDARLADVARNAYQFERVRHDSFVQNRPVPYVVPDCWSEQTWLKLIRYCRHRHIDPVAYIQWGLAQQPLGPALEPVQLLAPANMVAYVADAPRVRRIIRTTLHNNKEVARRSIIHLQGAGKPYEDACVITLVSGHLELSSLFRFSLAGSLNGEQFRQLADYFEGAALLQYQRNPDLYDVEWGPDWIRPGLREKAETFYVQLVSQPPAA